PDARRHPSVAAGIEHHRHLRDARSGRSVVHVRSHCPAAQWPHRPARYPGRSLRTAAHSLRGRLHRRRQSAQYREREQGERNRRRPAGRCPLRSGQCSARGAMPPGRPAGTHRLAFRPRQRCFARGRDGAASPLPRLQGHLCIAPGRRAKCECRCAGRARPAAQPECARVRELQRGMPSCSGVSTTMRNSFAKELGSPWFVPALLCLLVLVAFVVWPLASLFHQSAVDPETGRFSLQGFETFFESPRYVEACWNSVKLGVIAPIGALMLGAPLAYVVARYDFPGKGIVALLPLATIILPDIVVSQAWLMLLGNNGMARHFLESIGIDLPSFYGWFGMTYTLILNDYTYVYIGMLAALKALDGTIEEAAVNLGASSMRRFFTVTLPVLAPAILINAMIVFTLAVDNFSIPMILGGSVDVLSSLTYQTFLSEMGGNPTMQSVLAVVSVILVGCVLFVQKRIVERKTYQM